MPSPRSRIGRSAEILAASELGKRGYAILASNYRCRQGEIDLVCQDEDCTVFVEVRCKRTGDYGSPAESITPQKIRRLFATAQHYLQKANLGDIPCRFDVVEVGSEGGKLVILGIIRDAFAF